jgi:hypothetical protein
LTGKTEVVGWSDQMTLFIDLSCLYCKKTQRAFNVLKNSISKVIQNSIDKSVGTSHKALECLALKETLRFHSWR